MSNTIRECAGGLGSPGVAVALPFVRRYSTKRTRKSWQPDYVEFTYHGPYTMAYVNLVNKKNKKTTRFVHGWGFAKQRPTDRYNAEIGKQIALARAVKDALGVRE